MPWTPGDASGKTKKAKTPKAKRQWRDIANKALAGGHSEADSIKMANGVLKKQAHGAGRAKRMYA
jgi:hypothetical protein